MIRHAPRLRPFAAALAALAATLLLGGFGTAIAAPAGLLSWELFGLAIAGGAGFLAWHLAQLSALPPGPVARAALPAALVPLIVFPHVGAAALLVPATLAVALPPAERFAAALALAGTLAALGTGPLAAALAGGAMLAAAWRCRARCPAANDNPSLERVPRFWLRFSPMPASLHYAREIARDSGSEFGE
ncbi:hypothetical protein OMP43_14945 [Sphingomonas sp. CBMAI 2297]|uniref:hypothetical protein n=1 Tax=Sphingomonas sp. CBMAI 2297 TaxID=2991720 RepID=UPI0024590A13|nr:hypothetical protein [Sphingomonas sp. CBMAI 2297]MDH4745317.1 hypothetical protein [Sphingomonas sp. CBMAI 2297]